MLSTDDASLRDIVRRLNTGQLGLEHSPPFIAGLIEGLMRERQALGAQVRDLEAAGIGRTPGSLRTAYAQGWHDCQGAAMERLAPNPNACAIVGGLEPNYRAASTLLAGAMPGAA